MPHVLGVLGRLDQIHARPLATLDLVLQAGPGAIAEVAVLTLAHEKGLLQQGETLANGPGAWIGPEITPLPLLRTTVDAQARIRAIGQVHVGIGFVVAQQDVVRRAPLLDQGLLEQQRLGLVGGDGGFNLRDLRHQSGGLRCQPGLAEVAGEALLEVLGLAHI